MIYNLIDCIVQCSETPHVKLEDKETTSMLKVAPYPSEEPSTYNKITVWDEKGRTQIAQMFVSYGSYINSLAFQFIQHDKLVTSPIFGSQTLEGPNFVAVTFNDTENEEYITRISGSREYGDYSGQHEGMT
ncbi:hypothetical protein KSS87_003345 [Heliosperma pusillum]|nr:hypothetical protein KSS87_003345 [Heliosperma pusillum]